MNPQLEDLASLYVLNRLDAGERSTFEAQLSANAALATFVRKIEAALDLRRSLLRPHAGSGESAP